jgi:hypothetical protein
LPLAGITGIHPGSHLTGSVCALMGTGEEVCGPNATRPWHHLNQDRRIAGDVLPEVTTEKPPIKVDPAAGVPAM